MRTPLVTKGAALLAGHGVFVRSDVHFVQIVLQLLAGAVLVRQNQSASGDCPCRRSPVSRRGPSALLPAPGRS